MISTPKHLCMYECFGWKPPQYAHVGLLVDNANQKLSKRMGAIDLERYQNDGALPEAILNYLALLGWRHRNAENMLDLQRLIKDVGPVLAITCIWN